MVTASADPRLPKGARIVFGLAVAYLLFPVDLILDFIPGLGHLDDLIVVGFLIWLFFRLAPENLAAGHRAALQKNPSVGTEDQKPLKEMR